MFKIAIIFAISLAVSHFPATTFAQEVARLQIIHNSPDALAQKVDMWVNDDKIEDFPFQTATEFFFVVAGDTKISVGPANSKSKADAVVSTTFKLAGGKQYIVAAQGIISPAGYSPAIPFKISIYDMARDAAYHQGFTDILLLHGGTDTPEIDVWAPGSTKPLADNLKFGDFASDYFQYPANDIYLGLREPSGEPSKTLASYSMPIQNLGLTGKAVTVVLSGFADPQKNSNGARFGLYVVPPAGGNFITLPKAIGAVDEASFGNLKLSDNAKIFPNPCKDFAIITIPTTIQATKLNILNSKGEVEYSEMIDETNLEQVSKNLAETEIKFDTKNLSNGIYFIQLVTNKFVLTRRLVKIN